MKRKFAPVQLNYMKAKAMHETILKLEKQAKVKILSENIFYTELMPEEIELGEKVKRILDPISDYRMSESDFIEYCKLVYTEYLRLGIDVPDYNTTPTYKSFSTLKQAEKDLIKWGFGILEKDPKAMKAIGELETLRDATKWDLKVRDQVIDLTMQLAI